MRFIYGFDLTKLVKNYRETDFSTGQTQKENMPCPVKPYLCLANLSRKHAPYVPNLINQ
jgi:hypothetical protein